MPTYWCTAMYAVERSWAVDSSASSAATTRSSIGKPIGSRRRSIRESTRSSASAACSRGIAYSISVKRTSRVLAYTRLLASRCSERPISPARRRLSRGMRPGKRRPSRQKRPSTAFSSTTSWTKAAARPGGRGGSSVRSEVSVSALRVYGITNASQWSWESTSSSSRGSTSSSGRGSSIRWIVKAGTQLVAARDLAHLAGAVHEADPYRLRGQVPEAAARAVRGRRDRPRERLGIDVALVLHREPARAQLLAEVVQRDARLDRHIVALDRQHAPHPGHVDHHPAGAR